MVNHYIIKLVSRLLDMADEDYSVLTPIDREALRDVMTLGSYTIQIYQHRQ